MVAGAKGLLVFSSLFFYSWWNISYLPIILSSVLFNYVVGGTLNKSLNNIRIHKKSLLAFGIVANIFLLSYFKYYDFFIGNINIVFDGSLPLLNLVLPLAISFFTFQQIAYLVDSYRGETAEYDFLNYVLFVTFFPQLIAGPIVHHAEMMPQFLSRFNLAKNYRNISLGIFVFSLGLFKKVVIADSFAIWATAGFDKADALSFIEAWVASLSYTFQLYFDFSGYTDMAIGAALLFNIRLPINFNSPYKALDIQDFWRRWHITLSRFLRDYIYIPMGGNRRGKFRTYSNLLATFLIGGLWHGAGWTFVFWGFLHGAALIVHRVWAGFGVKLPGVIAWFVTFNFINITWVFFRAKDWESATKVLRGMIGFHTAVPSFDFRVILENVGGNSKTIIYLIVFLFVVVFCRNSASLSADFVASKKTLLFTLFILLYSVFSLNQVGEFIYYNF